MAYVDDIEQIKKDVAEIKAALVGIRVVSESPDHAQVEVVLTPPAHMDPLTH